MPENGTIIELPIIGEKKFISPRRKTCSIYEVIYEGKPWYCIEHTKTEHKEFFEYDQTIYRDITNKIRRCGISANKKPSGNIILSFNPKGRERTISLRQYLMAKYKNVPLSKVQRHMPKLLDKTLLAYGFADVRKCNLYDPGESRLQKGNVDIRLHENPNDPDNKCIRVTYHSEDKHFTEVYPYSEELYEMISSSEYCIISHSKVTSRIVVKVKYEKNMSVTKNLSHFVLLYNMYYDKYRRANGAIKRFIKALPKLSERHKTNHEQAAHINSLKWNGGRENLMWMNKQTNNKMHNLAACFTGEYNFFPIVTEENKILVEFTAHGRTHLYECATPEDYLDMQLILMGKSEYTKNLQVMRARTGEKILTPKETYEEIKKQEQPQPTVEEMVAEYWAWCEHRDRLLKQYREYPDDFLTWPSLSDEITEEQYLGIANLMVGGA